jgi:hypothetical protein
MRHKVFLVGSLLFAVLIGWPTHANAAQTYKRIPAGWKVLDSARGDVVPGGGTETVLIVGRKCRGIRKCAAYETVITQGSARRKVAAINSSIAELVTVSVSGSSVWLAGYQGPQVGYYEIWEYQSGIFVNTEAGGTS